MQDEHHKEVIDIWKTVVEVQKHFNDISMRIRSMFITILLALFASIGFMLDKNLTLEFGILKVQFATLVPVFGIFGTYLFYFIDRYWYHRLLIGSVNHAISIEKKYKETIPELSLSEAIGKESPYKPRGIVFCLAYVLVNHDRFRKTGKLHSDGKIEFFYKSVMLALFLMTLILAVFGGIVISDTTPSAPDASTATADLPTAPP